jgi:hypothetical protein
MKHRNAPFGVAAGSPNYAQGGSGNRFARQDSIIRLSREALSGRGEQETLPTFAPYAWAWSQGTGMEPEDAIAAGSGESLRRNIWGGFYYGYHPYEDQGYGRGSDNASYADMPIGYTDPLFDPDQDLWHYAVPSDAQPQVKERQPWHASFARAFSRKHKIHSTRTQAGHNAAYEYEQLGFEGTGE